MTNTYHKLLHHIDFGNKNIVLQILSDLDKVSETPLTQMRSDIKDYMDGNLYQLSDISDHTGEHIQSQTKITNIDHLEQEYIPSYVVTLCEQLDCLREKIKEQEIIEFKIGDSIEFSSPVLSSIGVVEEIHAHHILVRLDDRRIFPVHKTQIVLNLTNN